MSPSAARVTTQTRRVGAGGCSVERKGTSAARHPAFSALEEGWAFVAGYQIAMHDRTMLWVNCSPLRKCDMMTRCCYESFAVLRSFDCRQGAKQCHVNAPSRWLCPRSVGLPAPCGYRKPQRTVRATSPSACKRSYALGSDDVPPHRTAGKPADYLMAVEHGAGDMSRCKKKSRGKSTDVTEALFVSHHAMPCHANDTHMHLLYPQTSSPDPGDVSHEVAAHSSQSTRI